MNCSSASYRTGASRNSRFALRGELRNVEAGESDQENVAQALSVPAASSGGEGGRGGAVAAGLRAPGFQETISTDLRMSPGIRTETFSSRTGTAIHESRSS